MPSTTYAFFSQSEQDGFEKKPTATLKDCFGESVLANIYVNGNGTHEELAKKHNLPVDAVYLGTVEEGRLIRDTMPDIFTRNPA